jgi:type VI secretion system lysozyme-like protein
LVGGLTMALLEKLSPARRRDGRARGLERILRNLENMLNSKRGYSAPLLPEFGIRTLTEYGSRDAIGAAVIEDVRECIERYEPRLRLDSIKLDDEHNPLRLSFTLECTLVGDPHQLQLSFDTVFKRFDVARR